MPERESLVAPEGDGAGEAGRLIKRLPGLWSGDTKGKSRKLLLTILDAVYVDAKDERRIVAIKPKGAVQACLPGSHYLRGLNAYDLPKALPKKRT